MTPRPDFTPMETALDRTPWQSLPEMAQDLSAELAGVAAAAGLLAIWHMNAAGRHARAAQAAEDTPARRAAQSAAAARCNAGLQAGNLRRGTLDALSRMKGARP